MENIGYKNLVNYVIVDLLTFKKNEYYLKSIL
jgi:hypothetical protein